ncbi:Urocanase [Pseudocohnilembus persalinus]|uniref:urocanate hydratase n=1 Tax=Pseudocohnilembus persalinus TaxID=266149 RepID=A0A0V0QR39_PSEPJ|nr:Urocanase [Pseudocohnilembus persalinus]|eukprot:KRX04710.1 Urocanase [Pseudocohnilembus persalinus]
MQQQDTKLIEILTKELKQGIPLNPLPEKKTRNDPKINYAPARNPKLTPQEEKIAIQNALRYFPSELHELLGKEFLDELKQYGHIYMYRFRPTSYAIKAYDSSYYQTNCKQAAQIIGMIMNNLDNEVAQHPHELITYGGNGSVFSNWAQYHLVMKYLMEMNDEQTLILNSGHPQGLYPSHKDAPRVVICNGLMIPNYSTQEMYEKLYAMGVTQYGQMTAGSFCYIGSQGIVHGTTLTLLNAARKYLNRNEMSGLVYVTSGLGGMSGAQPKAGDICGCISVTAEINEKALDKRLNQGWVKEKITDIEKLVQTIKQYKKDKKNVSIAYLGNIVDVWERLAKEDELMVELGSDQTSLHNPYFGGYYPVGLTYEESNKLMKENSDEFKKKVQESLRRHVAAINTLTAKGMKFWDYGNSFLLEASRAGADILKGDDPNVFKYPSYVQDIMGDIFSLGFGPFRWVCMSQKPEDLQKTDKIAEEVCKKFLEITPTDVQNQFKDNLKWIQQAEENRMVVGSQARILYSDTQGRIELALRFNEAIKNGEISGPICLSRDHHDVSGTDSPFRETSNIYNGSQWTADMSIQNVIGDSFRGATWVSIHNGGGVGWGEVSNGGFGLVLDGSEAASKRAYDMLRWDVNNGVSRRAWNGNDFALMNIKRQMEFDKDLKVTLPNFTDDKTLEKIFKN